MGYKRILSDEKSVASRRNKSGYRRADASHDAFMEEYVKKAAERVAAERAGKPPEASQPRPPAPTPTPTPKVAPAGKQGPSATLAEAPAAKDPGGEWAKARAERARKAVLAKLAKKAKEEEEGE